MPIYEYGLTNADGTLTDVRFEVFQRMSEDHLTHCPDTGRPCRRVVVAPNVPRDYGAGAESRMYWYHPADVKRMRQELGTSMIRDDGRVVYANRGEARAFARKVEAWEARNSPPPAPKPKRKERSREEKRKIVRDARRKILSKL
jgi:hypothetical protein